MNNSLVKYILLLTVLLSINTVEARDRISLDKGWKFSLGHATQPEKDYNYGTARLFAKTAENFWTCITHDFDDSAWQTIDVPHDWAVALPFEHSKNGDIKAHGFKPIGAGQYPQNSIGWYRKKFDMPQGSDSTQRVFLTFDGVFRNSQVWVNNFYCGTHFSGYTGFSYDITDFLKYDDTNTIVVRADASQFEGWFYEGAGIYRHVWLETMDNFHFTKDGVFLYTKLSPDFERAEIMLEVEVENTYNEIRTADVITSIYNKDGRKIMGIDRTPVELLPNGKCTLKKKLVIANPELWDINNPIRYKAVSEIVMDGNVVDKVNTRFGIRDIKIDSDKGLFLNGRNIKIQGVCCHQDHAGLGSALPDYMQYYRIGLLKEMGVNAYRTSHNPPTPELLDACDSLGMLVLDEVRLLNSAGEYMSQLRSLVLRDRNHPSVFMWSIGNEEEIYQTKPEGKKIAQSMMREIWLLDPSRTITYGGNVGNVQTGVSEVIPVRGFNYNLYGVDDYRKERSDQPIFGSEVGSTVTTRGVYQSDTIKYYLTDFDENFPSWASTAESWWTMAAERDWFMGGFVWTGFDYRGEPTPYDWPNINSHFGIMDMCGFPKSIYYYYQSWWTDKDVLHIAPHWNWKGREGDTIKVWVNSNAESVELFLNGKSLGRKDMSRNGHLNWDVIYKTGTLKAVAYKGKRKYEKTVETTDAPCSIVLTPSKHLMNADGSDVVVVNVTALDKKGREVPDAANLISFEINGDAKIIGVGNGDPSCHEPDKCIESTWQRSLFNGKCQLILQAGTSNATIDLVAISDGLKQASIKIKQN